MYPKTLLTALALSILSGAPLQAEPLPTPSGPVILTISGAIGQTNAKDTAQFDMDMLQAIGTTQITTSTIWTEGASTFTGVPLSAILARVEATGSTLEASAINDYSVTIPVSDATDDGPILAFLRDGDQMRVRDKGPLWVIYPYDDNPAYQTEVIYSRSIWQLDRIAVAD